MKKTLAFILALMMILSVALVACGEKEEETQPNDDFFNDDVDYTGEGDSTGESDSNIGIGNTSGFVAVNDKVYARYVVRLRSDAKVQSGNVIAEIPFGTELQRSERNSKWSKVKYGEVEGYVDNDLIGTDAKKVTFTTLETPATDKIANLGNTSNAKIRRYPLAKSELAFKLITEDDFEEDCIIGQVAKDTEVTIISVSADKSWAYVKCTGKVRDEKGDFTVEKEFEGYCSATVLADLNKQASSSGSSGVLG